MCCNKYLFSFIRLLTKEIVKKFLCPWMKMKLRFIKKPDRIIVSGSHCPDKNKKLVHAKTLVGQIYSKRNRSFFYQNSNFIVRLDFRANHLNVGKYFLAQRSDSLKSIII